MNKEVQNPLLSYKTGEARSDRAHRENEFVEVLCNRRRSVFLCGGGVGGDVNLFLVFMGVKMVRFRSSRKGTSLMHVEKAVRGCDKTTKPKVQGIISIPPPKGRFQSVTKSM